MQSRHISSIYKDTVSITQVRRDIGILLDKLRKEGEVKVLRGQNILFVAVTPEELEKGKASQNKKGNIINFYTKMRKKHKTSLSSFIIAERERMKRKTYYERSST